MQTIAPAMYGNGPAASGQSERLARCAAVAGAPPHTPPHAWKRWCGSQPRHFMLPR